MSREPAELHVDEMGRAELPLDLLAAADSTPGVSLVAFGDGSVRMALRRAEDSIKDLVEKGNL
ncbi:hypothetical protein [Streptomyces buecherae]|uniref:hypothetical protein n=1 Tax=Streptomyces buecherae TaxID=2763006 RepID=UPI003795DB57